MEWFARWPNSVSKLGEQWQRISSLVFQKKPVSAEDIAIIVRYLDALRLSPDYMSGLPPVEVQAAQIFVYAKQQLERVPALLRSGWKEAVHGS